MSTKAICINLKESDKQLIKRVEEKYGKIKATELFRDALNSLEKNLAEGTGWGNQFVREHIPIEEAQEALINGTLTVNVETGELK
jgi:hypothetical protein